MRQIAPICWRESTDRSPEFQRFDALRKMEPRKACLVLRRLANRSYLLTLICQQVEIYEDITLTQAELNNRLGYVRKLMEDLRAHPLYLDGGCDSQGIYQGDFSHTTHNQAGTPLSWREQAETYNRFITNMAEIGGILYNTLFRNSRLPLHDTINDVLKEGDTLQIVIEDDALDFVYPWAWLHPCPQCSGIEGPNISEFWGYRYILEILPQYGETAWKPTPPPTFDPARFLMHMGYRTFPETATQKAYFEKAVERSRERLLFMFLECQEDWEAAQQTNFAHLYYFFSHGHTAMPDVVSNVVCLPFTPYDRSYIHMHWGHVYLDELHTLDLSETAPLVFLNMCESVQSAPALSFGFVDAFLKAGARSVIGTEIPMSPAFADLFARRFFDQWLGGTEPPSVGRTLYELRRQFMNQKNPLSFAYTLYGNATTRLSEALLDSHTIQTTPENF